MYVDSKYDVRKKCITNGGRKQHGYNRTTNK